MRREVAKAMMRSSPHLSCRNNEREKGAESDQRFITYWGIKIKILDQYMYLVSSLISTPCDPKPFDP